MTKSTWGSRNRERASEFKRLWRYKKLYNMSLEDLKELVDRQDNKCVICSIVFENNKFTVDHNHTTGRVRGLLCNRCNLGIGIFNDDEELLLSAVAYLVASERK